MKGSRPTKWMLQAGLLLLAWPVGAQVRFGEVSSNANGTISTGYTAGYGNLEGSNHGWTVGGAGTFSGSYHSPNFLSFNASLYLNQARANSNFQSISNASGFDLSTNIFSGSKFPGSVTYSQAYNSEGNYAVPGLANYVTHGNSDTFGIAWSENLPDVPSFSAGFQMGSSDYSVYGSNDTGNNSFHSLNLHSSYKLEGFNMSAYYTTGGGHSDIPQVFDGLVSTQIQTGNSAEGFNASHQLPLHGTFSAGINRSTWDSNYLGSNTTGTVDLTNVLASIHPTSKLSMSVSANYSDNLTGQLIQSLIQAGGTGALVNSNESSDSFDLMGVASYALAPNVQTSAFAERRTQTFLGESYGVNSYGGSATYGHGLFDGTFNSAVTFTANTSDTTGQDTLGFSGTENYSNQFHGWHLSESFGYSQNAQTLLVTYMNSFYNYSVNIRRNWGAFNLSAGAGGGRTALTQDAGTTDSSQSYNASVGYGRVIMANGSYSKASGQALATGAGLVTIPVPPPTVPSNLVALFGGDSYSVGLSSTPAKRLILSASYAKSLTNTATGSVTSANENNEFNTLVQYQFRKLSFTSGYSRLQQGFGGSSSTPEIVSTYYAGVSRWFNFF
ncbi:MAG TPA: hypothetical protein VK716_07465 [Terracidiphilus sp.]|nr:hypothetical protein [Terracidiphilus sp.]